MFPIRHAAPALGITFAMLAQPAVAAGFDITLNFLGGFTTSQQAIFEDAATYWESAITGYKTGVSLSGITIALSAEAIDGVNGVLGRAGPTNFVSRAGTWYTTTGIVEFDTADVAALESAGKFEAVALHEMAHVIGFGSSLWGSNDLYVTGSGEYTGAAAVAAYQSEYDPSATFVPVDIVSGVGTRDSHWSEAWAGGAPALMTGFLNAPTYVTQTTIASFEDLGYQVALVRATSTPTVTAPQTSVPLPASGALLLAGFGALGVLRRRRAA